MIPIAGPGQSGGLSFEGRSIAPRIDRELRRHLAGEPCSGPDAWTHRAELPWDSRHTGSAAIESAFTAAGLLRVTRLSRPKLWDCAAGLALLQAAGGEALIERDGRWEPFESFEAPVPRASELADLRYWCASLLLGESEAVSSYARSLTSG